MVNIKIRSIFVENDIKNLFGTRLEEWESHDN